jgi:TRAP-type mannitol/chloroaromatic compound transport system permease small subunit
MTPQKVHLTRLQGSLRLNDCFGSILLNNSMVRQRGIVANAWQREDWWLRALYFVLAMLFFADLDRHVSCFWFYRAQPRRHSS